MLYATFEALEIPLLSFSALWRLILNFPPSMFVRGWLYPYRRAYRVVKITQPDLRGLPFWRAVFENANRSIQAPPPAVPTGSALGDVVAYAQTDDGLALHTERETICLTVLAADVIQMRVGQEEVFSYSVAQPPAKWEGAAFAVTEDEGHITLSTDALTLRIERFPFRLAMHQSDGEALLWDAAGAVSDNNHIGWSARFKPGTAFYGLGEKASALNHAGRQFELLNVDPAGYQRGHDPIYMSIPFLTALNEGGALGLFFDNSYHSWVDVGHTTPNVVDYRAAGGRLCVFIMGGALQRILESYTELTGRMKMLPLWALGYHQCRWSYFPEAHVTEIANEFRARSLPCDGLHLDVHYMDGYRCFTWDRRRFPDPARMIKGLHQQGFKILTILDPGLKVDEGYDLYHEGLERGAFMTYPDGAPFTGPVWPGPCHFPDFSDPEVREWFGSLYVGLLDDGVDAFWNDMNEPALITTNPGHTSFVPDIVPHAGDGRPTTHAEIRNVYGMLMARASFEGLRKLHPEQRTMLMTRSGWAGVQRYAMHWTGDNDSSWDHLRLSVQMCLNIGLSGVAMTGPDIGGFQGEATPELFARWMEVGALMPFYRGHAWVGAPAQEPWRFGEEVEAISRCYLELRYRLLPYIYTAMWQSAMRGTPMMRAMAFAYPNDADTFDMDDQYMFGDALLVAPVLKEGATSRDVYLPAGGWIDYWTYEPVSGPRTIHVNAPLDVLPLFVRAGAVIPQWPVQQYVGQKHIDTLTLAIYGGEGTTTSFLYEDDGHTRGTHLSDAHRVSEFTLNADAEHVKLTRRIRSGTYQSITKHFKLRFIGMRATPTHVSPDSVRYSHDEDTLSIDFTAASDFDVTVTR